MNVWVKRPSRRGKEKNVKTAQSRVVSKEFLWPIAFAAALLFCGCSSTDAGRKLEQSGQLGRAAEDSKTDFATAKALENFESPPETRYTLGAGDRITVMVWAHPELSGRRVIGPDGDVQVPYVGSIELAGLTADDAGAKLTRLLSDYYRGPFAAITIDSYSANSVTVLGHVAKPGVLHFDASPTLLEVLARAGTRNNKEDVSGAFTRCAIFRGRDRVIWVDLRPLLRGDDPALNIRLRRNDLVYVPDPDELVYVMGQVKNPGAYPLTSNMSFLSALAQAGGANDNAQPGEIVLARPSQNIRQVIDLQTLLHANGESNYSQHLPERD